jgi:hygromycin-B 7''-O-kinase
MRGRPPDSQTRLRSVRDDELVCTLPQVKDEEHYQQLWREDAPWESLVKALAERHGLKDPPERYHSGTAVAYRLGDAVLKLYPPISAGDAELETWVLNRLAADSTVPSPRPIAAHRLGEWSYLLMTRLGGTPIEEQWPALTLAHRKEIGHQVGVITRALHGVSPTGLPRLDDDWQTFRGYCRERAPQHHLERGFAAERGAELVALLQELDGEPEPDDAQVLLHTEIGPSHVLMDSARVTGLFDFAEARAGLPEYDLAAVGLLVTRGDRAAFRAVLDGYGLPQSRRGRPLVRRLLRHALLHRHGHLAFYLHASPVPNPADLWAAGEHWFGH